MPPPLFAYLPGEDDEADDAPNPAQHRQAAYGWREGQLNQGGVAKWAKGGPVAQQGRIQAGGAAQALGGTPVGQGEHARANHRCDDESKPRPDATAGQRGRLSE